MELTWNLWDMSQSFAIRMTILNESTRMKYWFVVTSFFFSISLTIIQGGAEKIVDVSSFFSTSSSIDERH